MSQPHKQKKTKRKQPSTQSCSNAVTQQLKYVIKSLNQFLKQYFDRSVSDMPNYANLVKQYFIQQSTNTNYSCLISSLFSKISNMLQPFLITKPSSVYGDDQQYRLKEELSTMGHKLEKQGRKINMMKQELNKYKETSNKLTNFVYMLRVNNIDVDTLYDRGCRQERDRDSQLSRQSNTQTLVHHDISNFQTR